jgi:uncharacterized protein YgbK (DUF1537 family)
MFGVVADDLTGAAELAAVGARYGLRAEVLVKASPADSVAPEADLVCYDTDSRFCSPEEAARRSSAAAAWLWQAGAKWVYKKVDSVLRGQVTAEVLAVMRELKLDSTLLAPANPGLGRTIQNGRYFVHARPIDQTEFSADPEYPRLSSNVLDLMTYPKEVPICVGRVGEPLPDTGIILCEAGNRDDLTGWARQSDLHRLHAGGAEFFAAFLAARGLSRKAPSERRQMQTPDSSKELFVCGSTSEATRAFVETARRHNTPVFGLPVELAEGSPFSSAAAGALAQAVFQAFEKCGRVILHVGLPPVTERAIARRLVSHLAQVAEVVLGRPDITRVYVEGGATAAELVERMGWRRLLLVEELAAGVVTLRPEAAPALMLTMKPGSYRWPDRIQIGR